MKFCRWLQLQVRRAYLAIICHSCSTIFQRAFIFLVTIVMVTCIFSISNKLLQPSCSGLRVTTVFTSILPFFSQTFQEPSSSKSFKIRTVLSTGFYSFPQCFQQLPFSWVLKFRIVWKRVKAMSRFFFILNPLSHMPILGSSNSAANKDRMSQILTNGDTIF